MTPDEHRMLSKMVRRLGDSARVYRRNQQYRPEYKQIAQREVIVQAIQELKMIEAVGAMQEPIWWRPTGKNHDLGQVIWFEDPASNAEQHAKIYGGAPATLA